MDTPFPVLIENTAGGTNAMARGVEKLERLWASVLEAEGGADGGFCLSRLRRRRGTRRSGGAGEGRRRRIDLVHANDSRDAFDSGADRHANLGQGSLPEVDLIDLIREAGTPVIVETPGEAAEHTADIAWLRERL